MTDNVPENVMINFTWLDPENTRGITTPSYKTQGSSGMDVCAAINRDIALKPGEIVLVPTGFAIAIPVGFEVQVRPRSGLAIKHGITIVNAPGTIDSDYRGEVKIGLINVGSNSFTIRKGDRIAQLVVAPVVRCEINVTETLSQTDRGRGGFGHTGLR